MKDAFTGYAAEISDLTVAYDSKPVLWDVDLKIPSGCLTAIVGPNGAGKTTLIKAVLGLVKPMSGRVSFFGGQGLREAVKGSRIGYVPQSESVDWDFPATVLDVVIMGCYGRLGWIKRPKRADVNLALETLKSVGMADYASRQISRLSGGQQQRVFLARALMQRADLYFMDEPFKGVDAQTEKAVVELLRKMKEQGKTVVAVHHDLQTVEEYFDYVALINIRLIACGRVGEAFSDDNIRSAYRGAKNLLKRCVE
ncbi:MAG: metal ABC transporter ATP-binding protein [Christensenellales bacterium]|jgi:manganese/zinc/iron transport system ATP- binding protein